METETVTLAQIVDARKVLTAVEVNARKAKRSLAAVRVLHGVLDAETAGDNADPRLADSLEPDHGRLRQRGVHPGHQSCSAHAARYEPRRGVRVAPSVVALAGRW